jgi:ATP-binding cassette subfamily F protein uup
VKLGYKEARELEEIPALIEAIERDQEEIARKVADPATYQDRTIDVKALNTRHAANEAELERLLMRWEALEAKRGGAGRN